jgi:hypothetical protein
MSTGTAAAASNRRSSDTKKPPTFQHTLDIKAIVQTQTENAATLSKFKDDWNEWTKSVKETHGYACVGLVLQPGDMDWLGSGENHQSRSAEQSHIHIPIPTTVNNARLFPSFHAPEFCQEHVELH